MLSLVSAHLKSKAYKKLTFAYTILRLKHFYPLAQYLK